MSIENKSSAELTKSLIKETLSDNAAKTTQDIFKYGKQHRGIVLHAFGKYVKYFEDYFDILNNTIATLNYLPKQTWQQYKNIVYLLFPETLKTLHRAFEDILDGYYEEAIMLLRSVYEAYIKMIFVICYPEGYEAIFFNKKGRRSFNLTNFVKEDLKFEWEFLYRIMSSIYHAKVYSNLKKLIEICQGRHKKAIRLEYKYDKDAISRPINISTFLLYTLFNLMLILFKRDFDNAKSYEKHSIKITKIDKALRGILESMPNRFSYIAKDIDKIDRIIEEVNHGRDWKKII